MSIEITESIMSIIMSAKDGDEFATEKLLTIIRDNHMNRAIAKYLNKNRLAENDDIKQVFMIGVALNISSVRLDIGNPIIYLINCGIWRVRSYFRSQVFNNTKQTCLDCGNTCRPTKVIKKNDVVVYKSDDWVCPSCGSHHVDVAQCTGAEIKEDNAMNTYTSRLVEDLVIDSMVVDEFRSTLSGRVLQLFDMINQGMDRDGTSSYMRDIADEWGVSTACVAQYLKRLKAAWHAHFSVAIGDAIGRRIG